MTTRACQKLFVVSDETAVGLKSARRMFELVDDMGIPVKERYLVVNRHEGNLSMDKMKEEFGVRQVFGIPKDDRLLEAARQGKSVSSLDKTSVARGAVEKIGETLWPTG